MTLPQFQAVADIVLYFLLTLPVLMLLGAVVLPSGAELLAGLLRSIGRSLDKLAELTGHITSWLSLLMALVMTVIVVLRYVFGLSFIWMQESILYMHAALFLLAAAWTLWVDGHVRVDLIYRTASPKRKALIDFIGTYLFFFPVMFIIIDAAIPYVEVSWAFREGSRETSGIHAIYLLKSLILVFAWAMILQGLAQVIHRALFLAGFEGEVEHEHAPVDIHPQQEGDSA